MRAGRPVIRPAAALAALLLAVGLTACGGSSEPATPQTTEASTVPETTPDSPTGFVGTWVDPDGNGYLSFDGDGGITGSDACNGITTTYSVDGTTATVEPFPTTMMACGDGWSQWLLGVTTVELGDGVLTVLGRDGQELGTLVPGTVPADEAE